MGDLILRQDAIDVVKKWFDKIELNGDICIDGLISLPSAQQWIPCTERMPELKCDQYGNCFSDTVLLLINDDEYANVCTGFLRPTGLFETFNESGCFETIGLPVRDVKAWMPLPAPWEGDQP